MRSWSARIVALAAVVRIAKVRSTVPSASRQPSHSPASASGAPSALAIA
jgi:hypothetical protein